MLTEEQIQASTGPLASARTLPGDAYTSAEVFSAECQHIFYKEWLCVARQEQLPNTGDYLRVDVVGQPLIVVRLEDGALHAMSAICAHRAMPVVQGSGNTSYFQCPYHLWRYHLNGELASTPLMEGVEIAADCKLPEVSLQTWNGFIFVNLDPHAAPLLARLPALDKIVDRYKMDDMVLVSSSRWDCPWNWKILLENFMEAYHHLGPHAQSVQPNNAAKDSYVSGSVDDGWSVLHMPPRSVGAEGGDETLASVIMPAFCWLNIPGNAGAFWYQLLPTAHDQMTLVVHVMLPKSVADSPACEQTAQAMQKSIDDIHREDIRVNEGPWQGLNAPLTKQGPLSLYEESIWQLNQWWITRVVQDATL